MRRFLRYFLLIFGVFVESRGFRNGPDAYGFHPRSQFQMKFNDFGGPGPSPDLVLDLAVLVLGLDLKPILVHPETTGG